METEILSKKEHSQHVVTPEGRVVPKEYVTGAHFDATDLWMGDSVKADASVRLDAANGRIYYDSMVYVVYARNEIAPFGTSDGLEAGSFTDEKWWTYISSSTNGASDRETKLKIRYYHRYGFDNLRMNFYGETDNSGSSTFDNDIWLLVRDSDGGTKLLENNQDLGTGINQHTLNLDISSLTPDTYYIIEVDTEAQIGTISSGTPTAGTGLREDLTIIATTS